MGLAEFAAGLGPAGLDPIERPTPGQPKSPPAAIYFDLGTRDGKIDPATGDYAAMTPTQQLVQLSFGIRRGSHKSAPHVGATFHQIPRGVTGDRLQVECERRAEEAYPFSRLLAAGSVALERVIVRSRKRNELNLAIQWRDLVRDPATVQTTEINGSG